VKTAYFITESMPRKLKAKITGTKAFPIAQLDSKFVKHKEEEHKAAADAEKKEKDLKSDVENKEYAPLEEIVPEFNLHANVVYEFKDGRKIVHAIIPKKMVKNRLSDEEKFTPKWFADCGLTSSFIGFTRKAVFKAFPEILGKMELSNWSGAKVYEKRTKAESAVIKKEADNELVFKV